MEYIQLRKFGEVFFVINFSDRAHSLPLSVLVAGAQRRTSAAN